MYIHRSVRVVVQYRHTARESLGTFSSSSCQCERRGRRTRKSPRPLLLRGRRKVLSRSRKKENIQRRREERKAKVMFFQDFFLMTARLDRSFLSIAHSMDSSFPRFFLLLSSLRTLPRWFAWQKAPGEGSEPTRHDPPAPPWAPESLFSSPHAKPHLTARGVAYVFLSLFLEQTSPRKRKCVAQECPVRASLLQTETL